MKKQYKKPEFVTTTISDVPELEVKSVWAIVRLLSSNKCSRELAIFC